MKKNEVVLCGIAKDEDRYLVEWVAFHLAIGFDHIYIYDNMSSRPVAEILSAKIQRRHVTVIRWPSVPGQISQLTAYQHFIYTYKNLSEWAAIIDIDEFIDLKSDRDIKSFLRRFISADCVLINWLIFGSNGIQSYVKQTMIEKFTRASSTDFDPNKLVKPIYRLANVTSAGMHCGEFSVIPEIRSPSGKLLNNGSYQRPDPRDYAIAQINHYFIKSRAEWADKIRRGYTDGTVRTENDFQSYDQNQIEDISALRFLYKTKYLMWRVASRRLFIPKPYNNFEQLYRYIGEKKRGLTSFFKSIPIR